MADLFDLAYVAGIVDGEGNIGVYRRGARGQRTVCVTVVNTDARLMEWLKTTFGGNVRCASKQVGNRKVCFAWRLMARQAEHFLLAIQPYLRVKSDQADIALAYRVISSRNYGRSGVPVAELAAREALEARLRVLNHRGVA